ncbi:MAG: hypothetical protein WCE35_21205 [Bradyrhizobium sp.]
MFIESGEEKSTGSGRGLSSHRRRGHRGARRHAGLFPCRRRIALCETVLDFPIALCDVWEVKEIDFTSAAIRQWRKLAATTRAQIDFKLKAFAATGTGDVKALKGVAGMRLRAGD